MATFDEFISSLDRDFGPQGKGKKFEVFCKWFLQNDPQWSRVVDEVWHFEDYPDKWQTTDLGTDLVFRDKQGEIWAVQAKCFDEKYSTKKDDMNTFLADSGRKQVSRRLWLHTTNKIESKALQTSKDQEKPVIFFNLDDFREAEIDYPDSFDHLFQAKVKDKPTPDRHQEIAIKDVVDGFKQADRGQLIMACGTGKTFTTLWIKEALEANSTLVLLPSLGLLSQTLHEWAWAGNTEFDILNVCSDKSVGKDPEDLKTTDAPFRVTSDMAEIKAFLENPNPKVLFCTYQSSGLIADVQSKKSIPTFDLVIADEAHRCAGKVSSDYATILDKEKIRADKRLFTTATPRFISQSVKTQAKDHDTEVVDMNDAAVFGRVLHRLTFGEAIHYDPEPLLNDYRVLVVGVDEPMVKSWIKNYELVNFKDSDVTDARTLAAKIAVIKAMKDYDLKRIISFHSKIDASKRFSETFLDTVNLVDENERPQGVLLADYVSGKMKASDRKAKIKYLKTLHGVDRGLLANARCLSEGVDVPSLDGVAFIDPKGSQVDIIQSVGRAIRKVRGAITQTKGTIILPVFLEDADDPEEAIQKSNFKPIWGVLTALKSHDDELSSTLDEYRVNLGKNPARNKEKISDKIIFDLPRSVNQGFSDALRTVLVETTTESWMFWFGLLELFVEREGHALIRSDHVENSHRLGAWVERQRGSYNKGTLSDEKIMRLQALPNWAWDAVEQKWQNMYNQLAEFASITGSTRFLKYGEFVHLQTSALRNWVGTQRENYKLIRHRISDERIKLLEALPDWSWDPYEDDFWEGFEKSKEYFSNQGHINPKTNTRDSEVMECGFPIGRWVSVTRNQKENYEKNHPKRFEALDNWEPWIWNVEEYVWENNFTILKEFADEFGHARPFAKQEYKDVKLGGWVRQQRYVRAKMPAERKRKLEALPKWSWDPHFDDQLEKLEHLKSFVAEFGIEKLRQETEFKGFKIGKFAQNCKTSKKGKSRAPLNQFIENELNKIKGWSW